MYDPNNMWYSDTITLSINQEQSIDQTIQSAIKQPTHIKTGINFVCPTLITLLSRSSKLLHNIVSLSLSNCAIETINLKQIRLAQNRINNLNALKKCGWNNLKWLILEKNPINNAQIISHIKTDKMMECLTIDSMNLSESYVFKAEAKVIWNFRDKVGITSQIQRKKLFQSYRLQEKIKKDQYIASKKDY